MSGVWRAVACCRGCAVIFHSPMGCVHVAETMDLGSHYRILADGRQENMECVPLVSSNIREKDSIFGGTGRLRQSISYVMETYHPECLFIATSCVAGVIGDDAESESADAEMRYGIPVICIPYAGFLGGEYSEGYYKTAETIIERFFRPCEHVPNRILLLGDQMGPEGQYVTEVKRLLSLLGLEVQGQFPGYLPFPEWANAPAAELAIVLGTTGQSDRMNGMADLLEKKFGIHAVKDIYPIGWENTCKWILEIGRLHRNVKKAKVIIEEEKKRIDSYVKSILHITKGKKAVIGIGRGTHWYNPSDTISALRQLEMRIEAVILYDNLTDKEKAEYRHRIGEEESIPVYDGRDGQELIDAADILLTTNEIVSTKTKQFFIPMVPMVGTNGEIMIFRALYRLLCRYGNKGGIAYATI
ncbi:nitrogenase component 1 [Dialister invisus]